MNNRSSALARAVAVTALVVAFVIAIVVLSSALGGDGDSNGSGGRDRTGKVQREQPKRVPSTYEVKTGDTLISIAQRVGVPVSRIEELNPEIDPQSLIVGEQLELR